MQTRGQCICWKLWLNLNNSVTRYFDPIGFMHKGNWVVDSDSRPQIDRGSADPQALSNRIYQDETLSFEAKFMGSCVNRKASLLTSNNAQRSIEHLDVC